MFTFILKALSHTGSNYSPPNRECVSNRAYPQAYHCFSNQLSDNLQLLHAVVVPALYYAVASSLPPTSQTVSAGV